MQHPGFFDRAGPLTLGDIAKMADPQGTPPDDPAALIADARPLDLADRTHVSFLDNRKYVPQLRTTQARAVFVAPELASRQNSLIFQ